MKNWTETAPKENTETTTVDLPRSHLVADVADASEEGATVLQIKAGKVPLRIVEVYLRPAAGLPVVAMEVTSPDADKPYVVDDWRQLTLKPGETFRIHVIHAVPGGKVRASIEFHEET